jgi:hypothetical protein
VKKWPAAGCVPLAPGHVQRARNLVDGVWAELHTLLNLDCATNRLASVLSETAQRVTIEFEDFAGNTCIGQNLFAPMQLAMVLALTALHRTLLLDSLSSPPNQNKMNHPFSCLLGQHVFSDSWFIR